MNDLNLKKNDEIVQEQATAMQAQADATISKKLNFSIGSVLRALVEAATGIYLWLQGLIAKVLALSRVTTSPTVADADSWYSQFGYTRPAAAYASGIVTFSRVDTSNIATINIGNLVEASLVSNIYQVTLDTSNPYYNSIINAYQIPIGTSSVSIPVQSIKSGSVGNVLANEIDLILTPIQFVDKVTNDLAIENGKDAADNATAQQDFTLYINSLSKAIKTAIESIVLQTYPNCEISIVENKVYSTDTYRPSYFYAVVDDGSGNPPSEFIDNVWNTIFPVRALGIGIDVYAVVPIVANIDLTAHVDLVKYNQNDIKTAIETNIGNFIADLTLGSSLYISKLIELGFIQESYPGAVKYITGTTINGNTLDLSITSKQRIILGTLTVTVITI